MGMTPARTWQQYLKSKLEHERRIRVLDMAEGYGIDIGSVISKKMAFNKTRPHMHGDNKQY